MSILRSLHTGAAGIAAESKAIDVVGDNIANVNTIGFKKSRADFQDMLGQSIAGQAAVPGAGAGAMIAHVEQIFTQGALLTTDSQLDVALSGNGFFVVKGNVGGTTGNFFTRDGRLHVDSSGSVVNTDGMKVQGYQADPSGAITATVGDLMVPSTTMPATPTANVTLQSNLDSNSAIIAGGFVAATPDTTSNWSTTTSVYDSLGNSHQVSVYYTKTAAGAWDWHAMVDGGDLAGGTPGTPTQIANGTLAFNTDGSLNAATTASSSADFVGATPGQVITFDFGVGTAGGGTGFEGATQTGAVSTNTGISQDGFGSGSVSAIRIEQDGTVTGVFTNGQERALGQLAIATFGSEHDLARAGNGLWSQTKASGDPSLAAAGTGGRGTVSAGALEASNVDLGQEFVDLIAFQRGFSASSKIISTSDEMYQELVSLKR